MFVIRLPNGNLMVPQTATGHDGRILGDVYVEIGPQDADYSRLAEQALTPEEGEEARDRWRGWSRPLWLGQAAGWPCGAGSLSPRSRARTSDSRNLRWPPGVRMLVMRPEAAQRVTVFGSTRNRAATSPGVSRRSLLPSTFSPLRLSPLCLRSGNPSSLALNEYFRPRFLEIRPLIRGCPEPVRSRSATPGKSRIGKRLFRLHFERPGSRRLRTVDNGM